MTRCRARAAPLLHLSSFAAVIIALYLSRLYSFVLMHTIVEMFSIVVASAIFLITWNTRRFISNNYILFIGIAFLFVSVFDLLHTLAYKGLNVFPGFDANLPTQLWIAARYTGSMSLFAAPLVMNGKARPALQFWLSAAATAFVLASIFVWRIFPDCYVEGEGLTKFKTTSEYVVSGLFGGALALLLRRRKEFEPEVLHFLAGSLVLSIAAEFLFTLYLGVYDLSNMLGHFFKVAAYYLFYKALVETALVKPYQVLFQNLKRSESELREERDRAQNYLDVARTILVVIEADGRVGLINRIGCEILGRPESGILGRNWFDEFVPARYREEVGEAFSRLMAGAIVPVEYFENTVLAKGGEERLIAWHNTVLRDEQGRIIATLSSGEDITERRKVEEELVMKTRELERSNAELSQFASAVSHDLKAPLSTISGFAEVLQERSAVSLDEKGKGHLDRIVTAAYRMERLITDLLSFARLTAGGRTFEPVEAGRIAEMAVENLKRSVEESGAVVTIEPLPTVAADEMQLLALFQNLIGNALKFRREGAIQIRIAARTISGCGAGDAGCGEKPGSKARWLFSVSDNGIGIDQKHHQTIFTIFERVSRNEAYPGTGIGLAVCKKIVERHGGRIWVESEAGKGSTFYFTMP